MKTFRVKNFRNVGDITIDFTESPIIALTGDNEAGKTSLVKAFAVLGSHAYSRNQKDYIRDNTNGFGIALDLEDGTTIIRMKTNSSNIYEVHKTGEESWRTTTIDENKVPLKVAEVTGLTIEEETKELLQVRTYEDPLLFVNTSASTNYKVMYSALKVEQLVRAIAIGSEEVNGIKYRLNTNDISINTLLENIRGIQIYDIEALSNMKDRIKYSAKALTKLERAVKLKDKISGIEGKLESYKEVESSAEVVIYECIILNSINKILFNNDRIIMELGELSNIYTLEEIDVSMATKVAKARDRLCTVNGQRGNVGGYEILDKLYTIDVSIVSKILRGVGVLGRINGIKRRLNEHSVKNIGAVTELQLKVVKYSMDSIDRLKDINILRKEIDSANGSIEKYRDIIKTSGAVIADCTNCGESVVVDKRLI